MLKEQVKLLLDKSGGVNVTKIRRDPTIRPLIEELAKHTEYLPLDAKLGERIYQVINDLAGRPSCEGCGKDVELKIITHGYPKYCSSACSNTNTRVRRQHIIDALSQLTEKEKQLTQQAREETNLTRYGVKTVLADTVHMKRSMLAKHGVDNASKLDWVIQKKSETQLERYGSTHYNKLPVVKEAMAVKHRHKKLGALERTLERSLKLGYSFEDDVRESYVNGAETLVKHSCGSARLIKLRSDMLPACHECLGANSSVGEHLIRELLLRYLPEAKIKFHDRTKLAPFELDFYIDELKLGIEFHGSYWHSVDVIRSTLHQEKALLAEQRGVKLWQVLDQSQLPSLEARLDGIFPKRKLSARSLAVRKLIHQEGQSFFNANHRQGQAPATKAAYGLFDGNELVAAMSVGKPRFSKDAALELLRFCSLRGTAVRGAAGKLFKAMLADLQPTKVISYADLLWGHGSVYEAIGFTKGEVTAPSYLWVSSSAAYTRYQAQKHKLHKLLGDAYDASLTEAENMSAAGFYKVHDAGTIKYIWLAK